MMKLNEQKKLKKLFDIKNGAELTKLYCKSDVILLTDVIDKIR